MKNKICRCCKIEKLLTEFYKFKMGKNKSYYFSYCKECYKNRDKDRKEYHSEWQKSKILKEPWYKTFYNIKTRCNSQTHESYSNYGGKGIKCKITLDELKQLWFRDKAYLMKRPSIDRINSKKDYILKNCRFIELSENVKWRKKPNDTPR